MYCGLMILFIMFPLCPHQGYLSKYFHLVCPQMWMWNIFSWSLNYTKSYSPYSVRSRESRKCFKWKINHVLEVVCDKHIAWCECAFKRYAGPFWISKVNANMNWRNYWDIEVMDLLKECTGSYMSGTFQVVLYSW